MDILDEIISFKKKEVRLQKAVVPVKKLESSEHFQRKAPSFRNALTGPRPSIIGEFKKKSPSGGILNTTADSFQVVHAYKEAGLNAASVLTDSRFFGGTVFDLVNSVNAGIPVLRKDFIIDEYQIIESKSNGASAVLVIAGVLSGKEVARFVRLSKDLGLDVLFEIHDESDLEKLVPEIGIVGVNNRNLKTLDVNTVRSLELLSHLPPDCIKVSESGLRSATEVAGLYRAGYDAFLMGSCFMRSPDPGSAAAKFMEDLKIRLS